MTWRVYLLLAGLGLAAAVLVAAFQPAPGYMDANYYYAGGLQLVDGHGFSEPYLWNYLDDPAGLPHASNAYWMPLASLLAAAGAALFGPGAWLAARAGFLLLTAALPPLTAALAWSLTSRRDLAWIAGLLAVFSGFYLPYLPITDTFSLYMLLGGLFFLVLTRPASRFHALLLGVLAGLMHLARTDGLLWLVMAVVAVFYVFPKASRLNTFYFLLLAILGYLLIMTPWYVRNLAAFGTLLAPGGVRMLWLTNYDQLFAYPASGLTPAAWWQSGLGAILKARLWAFGLNLATGISVQGAIFQWPFVLLGFWVFRRDRRVQLSGLGWLLTLAAMTLAFPFAGARGGFFHSGAALQAVWWALAPLGVERAIAWIGRKRAWEPVRAGRLFQGALVGLSVFLTAAVVWTRLAGASGGQAWGAENRAYDQMNALLVAQGKAASDVVMVADPPGFYLASHNPSIAVPDGNLDGLLAAADQYGASYLILEEGSVPSGLMPVYEHPQGQAELTFLGEVAHARLYYIHKH